MTEPTCSAIRGRWAHSGKAVLCGQPGAVRVESNLVIPEWRCPAHVTLAHGYRLVRESDVRQAISEAAGFGHLWNLNAAYDDAWTKRSLQELGDRLLSGQEVT